MMRTIALGFALSVAVIAPQAQASPQTAPTAKAEGADATPAAAPVDPARLAAARGLIDEIFPPKRREAMIDSMLRPMMANIRRVVAESPKFGAGSNANSTSDVIIDQFMRDQEKTMFTQLHESLPGMVDAMAHAYARNFTVAQLTDLKQFFTTPAGQAYVEKVPKIMGDPSVLAWQRKVMMQSMGKVKANMASLETKLEAADGASGGGQ